MSNKDNDSPVRPALPVSADQMQAYVKKDLRADTAAGITVAIMGIPQAMAYAMIAGVPPVYGLYTSIVSCILGAMFGSSSHLVTGPTNASSWLIFSIIVNIPQDIYPIDVHDKTQVVEVVLLLTILTGLVKLIFGLLRLGGIVRYVSNSVVTGLTAGAGILIAGNQLKNIMNLELDPNKTKQFYLVIIETFKNIDQTNFYDLGIGIFTALIVIFAKKIHKKVPGPLLGVMLSTAIVYFLGWEQQGVSILKDLSGDKPIDNSLAIFHLPNLILPSNFNFGLVKELSSGAVAIAILGLVEASSSSRAVAASSGQKLNFSKEFVGQGIANIGGAFFLNFAGSGSFTRTALNYQAGAHTKMAAVVSAIFTAITILMLAPLANYIPTASLAGMLIVIAYGMVEKNRFKLALRSGFNSRAVLFVTLISTLIMPLQYAIFVGVFLSIVFLLKITSHADLSLLVPREGGRFEEVPYNQAVGEPIVLINMAGDFYFAAVENLDAELNQALTSETRVVILRMKRLRAVGSSAMAILTTFYELLQKRNISLVVCGVDKSLAGLLTRSGFRTKVGEQNIFYADNTLYQATELAVARARGIVEMERRRRDQDAVMHSHLESTEQLIARDMMSRQCIRFGINHSLREAVWLLSEMYKRRRDQDAMPLFLQDVEGKLAGYVTSWDLLEQMTAKLNLDEYAAKDDKELARQMSKAFDKSLAEFASNDIPECDLEDAVGKLIYEWNESGVHVLAIRDDQERVSGMVGQSDLLEHISKRLFPHDDHSEDSDPQESDQRKS